MIPVELQTEPDDFVERVKNLGLQFLEQIPHPTSHDWKGRDYWQRVLPDMRRSYKGVCAYCAHWIPHSTGNHSIDHFEPKSLRPDLAYEWNNFRYVSARFNSRKGTNVIVDPFTLEPDWFVIDFKSFFILPNPNLTSEKRDRVNDTIKCLKLNLDDDLVAERQTWFFEFQTGGISFTHLQKHSPFIAYEIIRQKLAHLEEY